MERGQFTFYRSFYRAIGRIRSKSARADAYDAVCAYALDGVLPELESMSDAAAIAFELIQPNLDTSNRKARARIAQRNAKDTGKISGRQQEDTDKISERQQEDTGKKSKRECECESEVESEIESECKCKKENECYAGEGVADFDRFWAVYPRKVSKAAAKQAFAQVEVPVEVLIRAVQLQKQSHQWQKDGGQFIPNPVSWLKQGRWEDELPKADALPTGASGVLGQAELDNIRRILAEGGEGYAQGG